MKLVALEHVSGETIFLNADTVCSITGVRERAADGAGPLIIGRCGVATSDGHVFVVNGGVDEVAKLVSEEPLFVSQR